jgi:hypothetical protein
MKIKKWFKQLNSRQKQDAIYLSSALISFPLVAAMSMELLFRLNLPGIILGSLGLLNIILIFISVFFKTYLTEIEHMLISRSTKEEVINQNSTLENLPRCPVCNNKLLNHGQNYCDECGQALKWDYKSHDVL